MPSNKNHVKKGANIMSYFRPVAPDPKVDAPAILSSPTKKFYTAPSSLANSPAIPNPSSNPHPFALDASPSHTIDAIVNLKNAETFKSHLNHLSSNVTATTSSQEFSSSLSSPPASLERSPQLSPALPLRLSPRKAPPGESKFSFDREIKGSDDEDSDSDGSMKSLSELLQTNHSSGNRPKINHPPSSPVPARSKMTRNASKSQKPPSTVLPKYKFDMKSLVEAAAKDNATEASTKRIKEMMEPPKISAGESVTSNTEDLFKNNDLLQSIVGNEEGGVQKMQGAIDRVEVTLPEYRWYFFETQPTSVDVKRQPFPDIFLSEDWRHDLANPRQRYQTFVSGFAEDMVCVGKTLPDEIITWMLDEICLDFDEALRTSYCSIMRQSKPQLKKLLNPKAIQRMFANLGGAPTAVTISHKVRPVQEILKPYRDRDWGTLCSVIKFLGLISRSLEDNTREHVICILLRLSADRVVFENVDILDLVHEVMYRLCREVPNDSWDLSCFNVCKSLFNFVELSTLRLQMVQSISSIGPRTHDLRRRLAMSFFFNDLSYSKKHSHSMMDLGLFMDRLDQPEFDTNPDTDYRELAALGSLLDIAVDDGRSMHLDLTDRAVEAGFDDNVEQFSRIIAAIVRAIGNPSPSYMSKIQARMHLLLVSQRIADTVRSRPKPTASFLDDHIKNAKAEERGRQNMARFLNGGRGRIPPAAGS